MFARDTLDRNFLEANLHNLCQEVCQDLRRGAPLDVKLSSLRPFPLLDKLLSFSDQIVDELLDGGHTLYPTHGQ